MSITRDNFDDEMADVTMPTNVGLKEIQAHFDRTGFCNLAQRITKTSTMRRHISNGPWRHPGDEWSWYQYVFVEDQDHEVRDYGNKLYPHMPPEFNNVVLISGDHMVMAFCT
jgi:hypothetical protein